jgi:hypothetical protein
MGLANLVEDFLEGAPADIVQNEPFDRFFSNGNHFAASPMDRLSLASLSDQPQAHNQISHGASEDLR